MLEKKISAFFLALLLLFITASCGITPELKEDTQTEESSTGATETKESKKTVEKKYPLVQSPLSWDRINAIPIASSDMSSDQLRQICVDYMRLQLSFQWTPNEKLAYTIKTYDKPTEFPMGKVYAGLPYNGPQGGPSGNLYTVMEYYDSETGVLDVESLGSLRISEIISNHCSSSCFWAWGRVMNTMKNFADLNAQEGTLGGRMNQTYGFLPVGPYRYSNVESWYDADGTKAVCIANGEQTMYESYAQVLPGDGCIQAYPKSSTVSANHVQMFSAPPVVVRNADGTIDPEKSYVTVMEQTSTIEGIRQADGTMVYYEGNVDVSYSFKKMLGGYYVPFTFAEFHGKDAVEKGEVSFSVSGSCETVDQLKNAVVTGNYPISSLEFKVISSSGEEIYSRISHPYKINCYSMSLNNQIFPNLTQALKGGKTLKLIVRLSTGEEIVAFQGIVRS